jgi:hypothetical protein
MNDMVNVIDGAKGCLNIVGGMTGLFSGDDIDSAANDIAEIINQIDKGIATIADITATVVGIAAIVNTIMDKDSKFIEKLFKKYTGIYHDYLNDNIPTQPYKRTSANCNSCDLVELCWSNNEKVRKEDMF